MKGVTCEDLYSGPKISSHHRSQTLRGESSLDDLACRRFVRRLIYHDNCEDQAECFRGSNEPNEKTNRGPKDDILDNCYRPLTTPTVRETFIRIINRNSQT